MQRTPILNFYKAKDFSTSMNITFAFLRQNFKGLSKSLLLFAAPMILLGAVFYQEIFRRSVAMSASAGIAEANPADVQEYFTSANFFISLFAALIFLLLGGVFTVSTTYAYVILYQDKQTTNLELGEIWKKTRQLFWTNFLTMFMYYMGLSLSTGVLIIPLILLVGLFSMISPFLSFIFIFAFYIAVFVLCIHFALLFYIRCREKIGFFDAVTRLNRLSKGKFWSTIWMGGTNWYIQIVLSVVFMIPWYLFFFLSQFHDTSFEMLAQPSATEGVINAILFMVYSLGNVLLTVIPLTAFAVQYHNLVEDKEARYLMSRIAMIGVTPEGPATHEDY